MVLLFVPKWLCCLNEAEWPIYVLSECWFISVLANFRFSVCPLFSNGHAEIFHEFRHDLCYKLGHIECPWFAAPGRSQHSCKTIGLFYVIIHFIRSRINWIDLIVGNMASNDEGQGSGDCDDVYLATHKYLSLPNDQRLLLLGPPISSEIDIEVVRLCPSGLLLFLGNEAEWPMFCQNVDSFPFRQNSGSRFVHFLAKVMLKFSVNFGMTCATN